MNRNKLKIFKTSALITAGFVLIEGGCYAASNIISSGIKPFCDNEVKAYKLIKNEKNKEGNFCYEELITTFDNLNEAILIYTPYEQEKNFIKRNVFKIDASNYSDAEINYIINNVSNQRLLLSQEYVQNIISIAQNGNSLYCKYYKSEYADIIPSDNNYEISYATFKVYMDETQMITVDASTQKNVNITYSLMMGGMGACYLGYCSLILKSQNGSKKKTKELKGTNNK